MTSSMASLLNYDQNLVNSEMVGEKLKAHYWNELTDEDSDQRATVLAKDHIKLIVTRNQKKSCIKIKLKQGVT